MAALLISMSLAALLMTAAMPVWKQMAQREKEEELIFRGQQYVHAITLYGRKFANTQPPSVDVLLQQKFLRKKFKDPITKDDFQLVLATQSVPGGGQAGAAGRGAQGAPGQGPAPGAATPPQTSRGISPIGTPGAGPVGGIMGVTSKSKDKSIRLYNGRGRYNEWVFMYQPPQQAPGSATPGVVAPGGRGGTTGPGPLFPGRGNRGGGPDGSGGRGRGPGVAQPGAQPFGQRGRL
jgi:type II secretory pathway pseudopilin PulG